MSFERDDAECGGCGQRHAPRTTPTRTSSSTRRRTCRRCSGGCSAGAGATPAGPSSATRRSRRGRCPPRRRRPGQKALAGKDQHAFRLSTNYRNSAEVFELAARVAQVAVPRPRPARCRAPHRLRPGAPGQRRRRGRAWSTAVRRGRRVGRGHGRGRRPRRPAGRRSRRRWPTSPPPTPAYACSSRSTPRAWSSTASSCVEPDDVVGESEAGWRTLYVVLTRATQRVVTVGRTDDVARAGGSPPGR